MCEYISLYYISNKYNTDKSRHRICQNFRRRKGKIGMFSCQIVTPNLLLYYMVIYLIFFQYGYPTNSPTIIWPKILHSETNQQYRYILKYNLLIYISIGFIFSCFFSRYFPQFITFFLLITPISFFCHFTYQSHTSSQVSFLVFWISTLYCEHDTK